MSTSTSDKKSTKKPSAPPINLGGNPKQVGAIFTVLLIVGIIGTYFSLQNGPFQIATARVKIVGAESGKLLDGGQEQTIVKDITDKEGISDAEKLYIYPATIDEGGPSGQNGPNLQQPYGMRPQTSSTEFSVEVASHSGGRAISLANSVASDLISKDGPQTANQEATGLPPPKEDTVLQRANGQTLQSAGGDSDDIGPKLQMGIYGFCVVLGILGLIASVIAVQSSAPASGKKPAPKISPNVAAKKPAPTSAANRSSTAPAYSPPSMSGPISAQSKPIQPSAPVPAVVRTLVKITQTSAIPVLGQDSGKSANADEEQDTDDPDFLPLQDDSESDQSRIDACFQTEVDSIFVQRLEEYKAARPDQGCILLVTECLPDRAAALTSDKNPALNGATAAVTVARTIAAQLDKPTLLIDTGSQFWSAHKHGDIDVIRLPDVPGLYDILAHKFTLSQCVLEDEEIPTLTALAPGNAPATWPGELTSEAMKLLLKQTRGVADLIIVYAPRCMDRPETVRTLAGWTNGILVVSGVNDAAKAAEERGLAIVSGSGTAVFGRISLDTLSSCVDVNAGAPPVAPMPAQ